MRKPLRIAVADDEFDMREYFQRILPRLGHEVVVAAQTGAELVRLCEQHKPDLVITDVRMPEIDGIQAASKICRDKPLPIILVSAYHDAELKERAKEIPIMVYLHKPVKQNDLDASISVVMNRFEVFQAAERETNDSRQNVAPQDRQSGGMNFDDASRRR